MFYETSKSTDAWLHRNLKTQADIKEASLQDASASKSLNPIYGFRVRVLRLMLALSAVAVAAMWYLEESQGLLGVVDRIGYPLLLAVTSLGCLLLTLQPGSIPVVAGTVFITFITYLLANYYYLLFYLGLEVERSSYLLATLSLWLPLGYVAGYVFFSPQFAVMTSLGIYAAIALPQALVPLDFSNSLESQIVIAVLISHPVYIAALWGVAQLKTHSLGVHDLAQNMSMAATEDSLTGVANRRGMLHALETVTQALGTTKRPLALLLVDVDHFKAINDRFGHDMGDLVLISLTQRAKAHLRTTDLIGRWGGEEFMILALDQTAQQALQMAERLRRELEMMSYPKVGTVTVSIGVAAYIPGEDINVLIKRADDALYQGKAQGRNRVEALFNDENALKDCTGTR